MYYPDVPALEPDELKMLCDEYTLHNATLDPIWRTGWASSAACATRTAPAFWRA